MNYVVSLDLETTGFEPGDDQIIEIAAIKYGVDTENKKLVHAGGWHRYYPATVEISDYVANMNGYVRMPYATMCESERERIRSLRFRPELLELVEFCSGCVHLGANPNFDRGHLLAAFSASVVAPPRWRLKAPIDILALYAPNFFFGEVEKLSLSCLCERYLGEGQTHGAYSDAEQVARLYALKLTEYVKAAQQ